MRLLALRLIALNVFRRIIWSALYLPGPKKASVVNISAVRMHSTHDNGIPAAIFPKNISADDAFIIDISGKNLKTETIRRARADNVAVMRVWNPMTNARPIPNANHDAWDVKPLNVAKHISSAPARQRASRSFPDMTIFTFLLIPDIMFTSVLSLIVRIFNSIGRQRRAIDDRIPDFIAPTVFCEGLTEITLEQLLVVNSFIAYRYKSVLNLV